jgi:flagellin-specific chaperone FliS
MKVVEVVPMMMDGLVSNFKNATTLMEKASWGNFIININYL